MTCPKCRGLLAPDHTYDVPAVHCLNCGLLILADRPVVMPVVPKPPQATTPHAIHCRETYRSKVAQRRINHA